IRHQQHMLGASFARQFACAIDAAGAEHKPGAGLIIETGELHVFVFQTAPDRGLFNWEWRRPAGLSRILPTPQPKQSPAAPPSSPAASRAVVCPVFRPRSAFSQRDNLPETLLSANPFLLIPKSGAGEQLLICS